MIHEGARLLVFNLPSDLQETNLRTPAGFTHLHHMENEAVFGQPVFLRCLAISVSVYKDQKHLSSISTPTPSSIGLIPDIMKLFGNSVTTVKLALALSISALFAAVSAKKAPKISNTVYLIRHGEKPADGGQGLTAQGEERAQCLTNVCRLFSYLCISKG